MGDPARAARHVYERLDRDGTWLIVEPAAGDRVEDNLTPLGRTYYGLSTLLSTPGVARAGGRARARRPGRRGAHPRAGRGRGLHPLPPCRDDALPLRLRGAAVTPAASRAAARRRCSSTPPTTAPRRASTRRCAARPTTATSGRRAGSSSPSGARSTSRLGVGPGSTVLDVACGSGGPALQLVRDTGAASSASTSTPTRSPQPRARHGASRRSPASSRPTRREPLAVRRTRASTRSPASTRSTTSPTARRCSPTGGALLRPGGVVLFTDPVVVTGLVSREELDVRASVGWFGFTPPGENERCSPRPGSSSVRRDDGTDGDGGRRPLGARAGAARARARGARGPRRLRGDAALPAHDGEARRERGSRGTCWLTERRCGCGGRGSRDPTCA